MTDTSSPSQPRDVPAGRITRAARIGGLAAGVAGNMAVNGLVKFSKGERPSSRDLLLTPRNIRRVTDELAKMRGAAMKIGQLLSMDTGDVLSPELSQIMARLRADADFMPPKQLRHVLNTEWGEGWLSQFKSFDVRPIAAASIGQVHRAKLKTGEELAIKVQYPGIARSIDSDVGNVGRLIKLSGLLPGGFQIDPYLDEARRQLHDEANYALEATHLNRFNELLASNPNFVLPSFHSPLTTPRVLAMSFVAGRPIETVRDLSQSDRNRVVTSLIRLLLRELFDFKLMQTDPNFANYRYDPASGNVVLLDFGATRELPETLTDQFRAIISAGMQADRAVLERNAITMGLMPATIETRHKDQILGLIEMVFNEIGATQPLDFGRSNLSRRLQVAGQTLAEDGYVPDPIPLDLLFVQRKIAGMFLLATRLEACVDVRRLIEAYYV